MHVLFLVCLWGLGANSNNKFNGGRRGIRTPERKIRIDLQSTSFSHLDILPPKMCKNQIFNLAVFRHFFIKNRRFLMIFHRFSHFFEISTFTYYQYIHKKTTCLPNLRKKNAPPAPFRELVAQISSL